MWPSDFRLDPPGNMLSLLSLPLSYASSPHLPSGCHCYWEVWVMTHLNDWNVLSTSTSVLFKNLFKSVAARVSCMNAHQATSHSRLKPSLGPNKWLPVSSIIWLLSPSSASFLVFSTLLICSMLLRRINKAVSCLSAFALLPQPRDGPCLCIPNDHFLMGPLHACSFVFCSVGTAVQSPWQSIIYYIMKLGYDSISSIDGSYVFCSFNKNLMEQFDLLFF